MGPSPGYRNGTKSTCPKQGGASVSETGLRPGYQIGAEQQCPQLGRAGMCKTARSCGTQVTETGRNPVMRNKANAR